MQNELWQKRINKSFQERTATLAVFPHLHPGCLEFELLESCTLSDMDSVSLVIQDCLELGIKFALDDFGSGHSSMICRKKVPVSQIKIDQSFTRAICSDPNDLAIVSAILGLARTFKIEAIAKGVETLEECVALLKQGCELGQGYAIAHHASV
jgi:EAL domain-containing protein (putative c-di-GMP-specific phosphodiesterase class I)